MSAADICAVCADDQCRPNAVWFGEEVRLLEQIVAATAAANVFIMMGTSANVHPSADFMALARRFGAATVAFNVEPSSMSAITDKVLLCRATVTAPEWITDHLL